MEAVAITVEHGKTCARFFVGHGQCEVFEGGEHVGFHAFEAVEFPAGGDELIDEEFRARGGGFELFEVAGAELVELDAVLGGEDGFGGVEAVRFCILARSGFSFGGSRSGGVFAVVAISEVLCGGCHWDRSFGSMLGGGVGDSGRRGWRVNGSKFFRLKGMGGGK